MVTALKLREFFPYWARPREHLIGALEGLPDEALQVLVRPNGRSVGDTLRHILAVEEGLLLSALLGEPFSQMRPPNWNEMSPEEKRAFYMARFGGLSQITERLREHTERGLEYLEREDAEERLSIRATPWGFEMPVHQILWHLEEHLVHHRAQVYLGLKANGFPAPEVT